VLDTPLSEITIVGVSVGAALMGMRPVAEMQFTDLIDTYDIKYRYTEI
jgi:2-oxoisovalerate dehydrogenase E1 component beta subunit